MNHLIKGSFGIIEEEESAVAGRRLGKEEGGKEVHSNDEIGHSVITVNFFLVEMRFWLIVVNFGFEVGKN